MNLHYNKYHGTGNDFLLVDNRDLVWEPTIVQVAFLCDRHRGIGADGLILLGSSPDTRFSMRYYNSDGRESTMCGNGGRCIVSFAHSLGLGGDHVHFSAPDGNHEALLLDVRDEIALVRLRMQDVMIPDQFTRNEIFLNTGSPHLVKVTDNPDEVDLVGEGRKFRYSDKFFPDGTNVNFMQLSKDRIRVRTYERGVEAETLSCGTGVTASALAADLITGGKSSPCLVDTFGGELKVYYKRANDRYTDVWLEGTATFVFSGDIKI